MENKQRLDKSAKANSLYNFFKDNSFLIKGSTQIKTNYSKGKESPWSLSFSGHCLKDIFGIDNNVFCSKYGEAISGDGQEATKIMTLHSSSLASLLVFFSVSKDNPIFVPINGKPEKFNDVRFEVKNEVDENSNNYSNIDVVLYGDNCMLYLESKFSEYLGSGPVEVKDVKYYNDIYKRLEQTLSNAGVSLQPIKGKRCLTSDDGPFYCEGLKQMISHYLGLRTEIKKGYLAKENRRIILGEILFTFGDIVNIGKKKLEAYSTAYSKLKEGLKNCVEGDEIKLEINDLTTYQEVLHMEENKEFLKNMPENVRVFYRYNTLLNNAR